MTNIWFGNKIKKLIIGFEIDVLFHFSFILLYGTLEFISNVPYYGIFLIKPGGVGLCLFPLFPPPPPPGLACHLVLAHSITGAQAINTCQRAAV
jgi:hypothetical protein